MGALSAICVFSFSNQAHAGVLSFLSNFIGGEQAQANASESKYNSQNLNILGAAPGAKLAVGGGDISIVDSNALEYQVETSNSFQSDQISVYVVREGDTLSQIAKMFNVSINTIIWANDIKNGSIAPGESLVILPVTGVEHIVKKDETIQGITKLHGGDLEEVLAFNNLHADDKLTVGDKIIIPDGDATASASSGKPATSSTPKPSTAGYFAKPIVGPYRKTQGIHGNNAVDLAVPLGTKIVASAAGRVIVSKSNGGYNGGYGNYIVIAHPNGTQTLYAHLTSTVVGQGVSVSQGQLIGYSGSTGRSTGPHLHFEVRGAKNPF